MKKLISGLSAIAMAAAMAMSASAVEINQDDVKNGNGKATGDSTVTYDVDAAYTVTIPAGADITSGSDQQSITASDVLLEQGKKITVTLSEASNTASGKSFTAKDESGESTVNYTIKAGDADVAVGDPVAEFETKTGEQSATLTFTKDADSTPTYAGKHTETLTFNIAVEDAATTKTLTLTGQYFDFMNGGFVTKSLEIEYTDSDTWKDIAGRYDEVSLEDNMYGPSGKIVKFWGDEGCELKSNESTYNYKLVSINDKVSAYSSYYLQS